MRRDAERVANQLVEQWPFLEKRRDLLAMTISDEFNAIDRDRRERRERSRRETMRARLERAREFSEERRFPCP